MITVGSLFAGYLGLDLGVEAAFGGTQLAWVSEIDPGASKIIAHHHPTVPNLGDITAIDWTGVPPVDILTGGWPCQPFSQAGKRKGAADERALWPEVARAVRALRPRYVVLENVSAIATAGELERATASLAALGYVGSWLCLRASDIGAPHRRERIFILATRADVVASVPDPSVRRVGLDGWPVRGRGVHDDTEGLAPAGPVGREPPGCDRAPISADHDPLVARDPEWQAQHDFRSCLVCRRDPLLPTPNASVANDGESFDTWEARRLRTKVRVGNGNGFGTPLSIAVQLLPTPTTTQRGADANRDTRPGAGPNLHNAVHRFGRYAAAVSRWEQIIERGAPEPTIKGRLNPRFVEWMQGCPDGWVCDVPDLSRAQQLKALGNGVVPQQATAAIRHMINHEVAA